MNLYISIFGLLSIDGFFFCHVNALISKNVTDTVLLACLYLNLSKNASLKTAFFRKADAKIEPFLIPAKQTTNFFSKKIFFYF